MTYEFAFVPRAKSLSPAAAPEGPGEDLALKRHILALEREEVAAVRAAFKRGITPETLSAILLSYVEPIQVRREASWLVYSWTICLATPPAWARSVSVRRWDSFAWPRPAVVPSVAMPRAIVFRREEVAAEHGAWQQTADEARRRIRELTSGRKAQAGGDPGWESRIEPNRPWPVPGDRSVTRLDPTDELHATVAIGSFFAGLAFVGEQAARQGCDLLCVVAYDTTSTCAFDTAGLEDVVRSKSLRRAREHAGELFNKHREWFLRQRAKERPRSGLGQYLETLPASLKVELDDHEQCLGEYLVRACKWNPQVAPSPADRFVDLSHSDLGAFVGELERVARGDLRAPLVAKVGDEYGPSRELVRRVLREFSDDSGHENAKTMAKLIGMAKKAHAKGNRILVYWEA